MSARRSGVRIDGMVYRSSVACTVQLWLAFGRGVAHARLLASCKTLENLYHRARAAER